MPARLNRRRYKEAVIALKQIISDQKTPAARRLHAVELLLGVYDKHDRTEVKKEAQRRAAQGAGESAETTETPEAQDEPQESVEAFLARVSASGDEYDNQ